MYKDPPLPSRILIVKTSSLGDIIQAFSVLDELHRRFPGVLIDWVVEERFYPVVEAHPLIHRAIPLHLKKKRSIGKDLKNLRNEFYDLIFDIQGNCKSGLITLLSRGKVKVGYSFQSVREWPNILATQIRFTVSKEQNIRAFYLELLEQYFKTPNASELSGVAFKMDEEDREKVSKMIQSISSYKIMVCPGSKWMNKQLPLTTWISFLQKIEQVKEVSFLLIWGDETEKAFCGKVANHLKKGLLIDKLSIPAWQNLMRQMDLVIAVDSSALHLCGTTSVPSFSIFGPTSSHVFKPIGSRHFAFQGSCPYGRTFDKQCPILRSCPTGACIRDLSPEELFNALKQVLDWPSEESVGQAASHAR